MDTFFKMAKDVDYFKAIVTAVEIRTRADANTDPASEEMKQLVGEVIERLITKPEHQDGESTDEQGGLPAIRQLSELMKQLKT